MKLFCTTLFVLVHLIFAVRLQTAAKPEAPVSAEPQVHRVRSLLQSPPLVVLQPSRDDPAQELFETNPSIESNPDVLLDPDQPYPDINHFVGATPVTSVPVKRKPSLLGVPLPDTQGPSAKAPSTVGESLGSAGTETKAFRRKCYRCCKVTKDVLKSWKDSPTRACNVCKINKYLPPKRSGNCKEGKWLGKEHTPTSCFFERCHQMLLDRTRSCMCFWDTRSSGPGAVAR